MKKSLLLLSKCKYLFALLCLVGSTRSFAQCGSITYPANAEILANVPEASGYNLVYQLPVPATDQNWQSLSDIPYSVNNSTALSSTPFTRVAYYVKLVSPQFGTQWVWVSMNTFSNDLSRVGIPIGDIFYQQLVANMNIRNSAGVIKNGISGNIEFWSRCYNANNGAGVPGASETLYDFGDASLTGDNCYGSFQVHDYLAGQTVFGYNGWSYTNFSSDDLGIGSNNTPGTHPDWTLASNTYLYSVRELYVFANTSYAPGCNPASLVLNSSGNATLTTAMVTNATVGSCGVTNIQLSKSAFTCADRGNNTVTVTFTVNGNTSTCTSVVNVADNTNPTVTATGSTTTLGCDPTAAAIEAALGTATASDNCGTPTLTPGTAAVVSSGNNRSQTRTWVATDASGNTATTSRTVTWTVNCAPPPPPPPPPTTTGNTYPSSVSCAQYNAGANTLTNVCYKAENRKVKKVSPKYFLYYTKVTAPAVLGSGNSFYVDVIQTKSCVGFKFFEVKKIRAYDLSCNERANANDWSNGQARVKISGATPGRVYVISVKYKTKSLEGSTYSGNVAPVCQNSFVTRTTLGGFGTGTMAPNSQSTILVKPDCYVNGGDDDDDHDGNDDDDDDDDDFTGQQQIVSSADDFNPAFRVTVSPNPTADYFQVVVKGNNQPVTVRVANAMGKSMFASNRIAANNTTKFGYGWAPGTYFVEIIQGQERKTVRLVKQ